ncbi:hypothetical protein LWI29_023541 [Acer saccharum]|uniref:Uncharacterized protein n=1 Tax=Acer saccharum TaxID=4024 RepID=A0AA39SWY1_ACESA|nr:hypothetical protein LWI29_023541 [Acer saccharum]
MPVMGEVSMIHVPLEIEVLMGEVTETIKGRECPKVRDDQLTDLQPFGPDPNPNEAHPSGLKPNVLGGFSGSDQGLKGKKVVPTWVRINRPNRFGEDSIRSEVTGVKRLGSERKAGSFQHRKKPKTAAVVVKTVEDGGPVLDKDRTHSDTLGEVAIASDNQFEVSTASVEVPNEVLSAGQSLLARREL